MAYGRDYKSMARVPEVAREKISRSREKLKYLYYTFYIIFIINNITMFTLISTDKIK